MELGGHSGVFETQKSILFSKNGYAVTGQENQRLNRTGIIIVFILSSQKNYCIAQFKGSFSSGEKTAHG